MLDGGGSLEDLWPFNEEIVARSIYESEIPIISAVGHETDFTISDFVADLRAPTPSAAAELAVADISDLKYSLDLYDKRLKNSLKRKLELFRLRYEKCMNSKVFKDPYNRVNELSMILDGYMKQMENSITKIIKDDRIKSTKIIAKLDALSPLKTLTRGYSITEYNGKIVTSKSELKKGMEVDLRFQDGNTKAIIS